MTKVRCPLCKKGGCSSRVDPYLVRLTGPIRFQCSCCWRLYSERDYRWLMRVQRIAA